jgi:hypothetical protein
MHWLLDVEFKDDLSRYRTGHGAKNMAVVWIPRRGLTQAAVAEFGAIARECDAVWAGTRYAWPAAPA